MPDRTFSVIEADNPSDPFLDIRPYNDAEVAPVLARLLSNPELLSVIAKLRTPRLARLFGRALHPIVRLGLQSQLDGVVTVRDFQVRIESYVSQMLQRTSDGLFVSGLEDLDPGMPHLFVSNHRDITLDPALVNYALHKQGRDTVRIAIGDNLLTRDYATDLMRLNKSFIVERSVRGPRQMLISLRHLSSYIVHSIVEDKVPVWIAQREGRAKDGWDRTEPAIIKMLTISMPKGGDLSEHIKALRIVPVSISYELDPLDAAKARELYEQEQSGDYQKAENEDLRSIGAGIAGNKGEIHVHFGEMLSGPFDSPTAVADDIDRQVVGNYKIQRSNLFAWRSVHGSLPQGYRVNDPDGLREAEFMARINALPREHRSFALQTYLNPIANRRELGLS